MLPYSLDSGDTYLHDVPSTEIPSVPTTEMLSLPISETRDSSNSGDPGSADSEGLEYSDSWYSNAPDSGDFDSFSDSGRLRFSRIWNSRRIAVVSAMFEPCTQIRGLDARVSGHTTTAMHGVSKHIRYALCNIIASRERLVDSRRIVLVGLEVMTHCSRPNWSYTECAPRDTAPSAGRPGYVNGRALVWCC